jgi:hypothetical protein
VLIQIIPDFNFFAKWRKGNRMKHILKISIVFLCIALIILAAGCGRVNKENYDKLSLGMDYLEVIAILGQPDQAKDVLGGKSCTWGNDKKNIRVKFLSDKVVFFSAAGIQ